jgi:hypothetical protein
LDFLLVLAFFLVSLFFEDDPPILCGSNLRTSRWRANTQLPCVCDKAAICATSSVVVRFGRIGLESWLHQVWRVLQ